MADEHTETEAHGTNGVSASDARAAFLAGEDVADEPKAEKAEVEDDDSDLEDEDAEETVASDEDSDPDADLDEEDDEKEEKPDADTAKRLSQVYRTDKHVREQREKDFAARDRQFAQERDAFVAEWKPKVEAAEKFERAVERINVDPIGVLTALKLKPEAYEHTAQVLYTLAKAKDDPKAQAAVAKLIKDRELEDKLDSVTKKLEEQEKTAKERAAEAAADAQWNEFFTKVEKHVGDKTPLAKALLKSNPTKARERITIATEKFVRANNRLPSEREIAIAVEKDRRQALRDMGIDPKTISASAANAAIEKTTTTTKTKTEKKPTEKVTNPRDAFIRGVKFD